MSNRRSDLYTFGFAGAICIFCAVILANAATLLKPRQQANIKLDIVTNILTAVGHDVAQLKEKPVDHIFKIYQDEIKVQLLDKNNVETSRDFMEVELAKLGYPKEELADLDSGLLLAKFNGKMNLLAKIAKEPQDEYDPQFKVIYVHKVQDQVNAYVIPIQGYGLWDIIKGYVALDTDLNTIKGVTFYEHKETPGLGAVITADWFKEQFKGKKILDQNGHLTSVTVAKGKGRGGPHEVDGISGATLTGNGINQFLKADLGRYEPYFKTLRGM